MKPLSERMQKAANSPPVNYDWIVWLAELRSLEARLEALERFHKAFDVVEDGVSDFHLLHKAVTELGGAHRGLHPDALARRHVSFLQF